MLGSAVYAMQWMGLMMICCGMALQKLGMLEVCVCEEHESTDCEDEDSDTGWYR